MAAQLLEPGRAGESLVKDVEHPVAPPPGALDQEGGLLGGPVASQLDSVGLPVHGRQGRRFAYVGEIITVSQFRPGTKTGGPPGGL